MAEVEKKKKLSKKELAILGILGAVLLSYGVFAFFSAYQKVEKKKKEAVSKSRVSPAQVSPETVAKAIKPKGEKKEQERPSAAAPPPPQKEEERPKEEKPREEKKTEAKKEWKLPEPSGRLKVVADEKKKRPFTFGLPTPSKGGEKLFKMEELQRRKVAERMKVITPRLVVVGKKEAKKASSSGTSQRVPPKRYQTVAAAGMFVPAVLTHGIRAPIGYKVPVRFRLVGSAVGVGSYSFPMDSCVVLGAGKGLQTGSTARIEVELIRLACVWPDGKLHTVPVNGYAVDSADGRLYLSASLEEHAPEIVRKSFIAGALLGAAEAAQKAQEVSKTTAVNQTTSVTTQEIKNPTAYTFWGGVAGALSQTQKLIEQSVAELTKLKTADRAPGGKVYLVFTQDVRVPEEWLKPETSNNYDFAGYER
jgi:hypothetical protein